jgi:hypothetical protein
MNELNRKNINEDKQTTYNVNSFRGMYSDKHKLDKEIKLVGNILSPRLIFQSTEKNEKEIDKSKQMVKPRLLTGKLPSAFDMKYRRYY